MAGTILDGVAETAEVLRRVAAGVDKLLGLGIKPTLVAIQANNDPGTGWYAKALVRHCADNHIELSLVKLPTDASEDSIVGEVVKAGEDPRVSAILVFMPLPPGVSHLKVVEAIPPAKDAEGIHPANLGKLLITNHTSPLPCT
ncbi:MAG: bifunctional methylenetetrahydrofolate dehydrogenase/methenyltetrahydrofolate cyclohydrolase, partial [Planctomycetota bacterium]|nr:bifunctional methylenetetrahydrofolate dehydrogenase/methenyltetrahydrofolate cyclohydrolase [Planctomycetota bacterium]